MHKDTDTNALHGYLLGNTVTSYLQPFSRNW